MLWLKPGAAQIVVVRTGPKPSGQAGSKWAANGLLEPVKSPWAQVACPSGSPGAGQRPSSTPLATKVNEGTGATIAAASA